MLRKFSRDKIEGLTPFHSDLENMLAFFVQTPVPTIILDSDNTIILINDALLLTAEYGADAEISPYDILDIPGLSELTAKDTSIQTNDAHQTSTVMGHIVTSTHERLSARFSIVNFETDSHGNWRIIQVLDVPNGRPRFSRSKGSADNGKIVKLNSNGKCGDPEAALTSIIDKSVDGFVMVNDTGSITVWNPGMEKITGLSRKVMEGRYAWDVLADYVPSVRPLKSRREELRVMMENAIHTGRSPWFKRVIEIPVKPLNKQERIIQFITFPISCDEANMIASIVRDVTGLKELEEERRKADKLKSLSILTGGLAHDFNDILTSIIGNISLAKTYVTDNEELYAMLVDAEVAGLKARDLTQRILDLSKGAVPFRQRTEITQLIQKTTDYCISSSKLECMYSLPDDIWTVDVDPDLIGQVISHIVQNADKAMPDGGAIFVSADNVMIEDGDELPVKPGPYVKIDIKDRGQGIPSDRLPDIFDPYFGQSGEGDGIGLAASYSIVKHHGGHITVDNSAGIGTTFTVYLPAFPEKHEEKTLREQLEFSGSVLVMDDDVLVRTVISRMLEKLGAHIDEAADGEEAVRKYTQAMERGESYDVVVLDLVIPDGLGGVETLKQLRDIDPTVRAVVSSGYTGDPVMLNYGAYGFRDVIRKPYQMSDLARALNRAVSG